MYGDQGQGHNGGGYDDYGHEYGNGGDYPEYGKAQYYSAKNYPTFNGVGYGHGGRGQQDFIEYQGPSGYGGGVHGGGYAGGYGYQRPLQLLRIIKEDEPERIFETFL